MEWHSLIAFAPILLVIVLMFVFKKPLLFTGPITYVFTLFLVAFIWKMKAIYATASTLKGVLVAIDITIIIFGAIFFLEFLKRTGMVHAIETYLSKISPDRRIQAIILAWFLVSFIEGTAGFGTPAAIVAPLLVGIGFPAITAVVLALIGDSTAVVFGAVGTPIRIGFEGLATQGVAFYAGLINLIAGILVPIMILIVLIYSTKNKQKGAIKDAIPFAIWAGLCLTIPYFLLTFVGQEFPSLVAPVIGLMVLIITTKLGFLVPKKVWRFGKNSPPIESKIKIFTALVPYILLIGFLVAGKYVLKKYPVKILGVLPHAINTYNPGILFVLATLIFALFFKYKGPILRESALKSVKILIKPFIVIFFVVSFVQIMINSGNNYSGLSSMIGLIASIGNTALLPFVAPFIGAFGAFIAGSATVSNILFGSFQATAAMELGMSVAIILALQVVGAGLGNMIALTNIVAAQATVHLHNKEVEIFRMTIIPALIYSIVVGLIGLFLIYVLWVFTS